MALDKLVDSTQLDSDLSDIAEAIRAKSGGSSSLAFPNGFVSEVQSIQTGTGDYDSLLNKPQINGVTLSGNKTQEQLGIQVATDLQVQNAVDDWLDDHASSIDGLSFTAKNALLACFRNVAWINDDGQTYYDALEDALFNGIEVVSISAVYTQSGYVFTTDSLDTLKSGLVVTAHYSDSSTATVSSDEYTLSGTLTAGTSTVTVSCGGKTTTFTVTVSEVPAGYNTNGLVFFLDGKTATASSWIDRVGSREFALTNCSLATNGVQFNGSSSYGVFQGSISDDWQDETIEVVFDGRETITSSTILSQPWDDDTEGKCGICMRFGYNNANQPRFAIVYDADNHPFYYATLNQDKNRVGVNVDRAIYNETAATGTYSTYYGRNRSGNSYVGSTMGSNGVSSFYKGKILAVRIYNRKLSQAEIVANQQVDATYYEL